MTEWWKQREDYWLPWCAEVKKQMTLQRIKSQRDLAKASGVSLVYTSQALQGKPPTKESVDKISEYLHIPSDPEAIKR